MAMCHCVPSVDIGSILFVAWPVSIAMMKLLRYKASLLVAEIAAYLFVNQVWIEVPRAEGAAGTSFQVPLKLARVFLRCKRERDN
jgi:hypothetical protein